MRMRSPEAEPVRPAQAKEGAVRAAQVLEAPAAVAVGQLRMAPRHELVLGEDDVAALAAQHQLRARRGGRCRG